MGPSIKITPNLILRIENGSKAAEVLDLYIRNVEFEQFEPTRPINFYTEEYHRNALIREYRAFLFGNFLRYYIYLANEPKHIIGSLNFNLYTDGNKRYAEMGYKIDKAYQRMGYAYEACLAGLSVMSTDYHLKRIDLRIHPDNEASLALARKMGFSYVRLEEHSANILGMPTDIMRFTKSLS